MGASPNPCPDEKGIETRGRITSARAWHERGLPVQILALTKKGSRRRRCRVASPLSFTPPCPNPCPDEKGIETITAPLSRQIWMGCPNPCPDEKGIETSCRARARSAWRLIVQILALTKKGSRLLHEGSLEFQLVRFVQILALTKKGSRPPQLEHIQGGILESKSLP